MSRSRMAVRGLLAVVGWAVLAGGAAAPARAGFTSIVAFGDSLSDTGNVFLATGGALPGSPPYFQGRFSNGPIWIDRYAALLGIASPTPSLAGGSNFAFGGAQSGIGTSYLGTPNLLTQVGMFQQGGGTLNASQLVTIWVGANDFLFAGETNPSTPAANIAAAVNALAALGGRSFLLLNMPALGATPGTKSLTQAQRDGLNALSAGFNQALQAQAASLRASLPGVSIYEYDVAATFASAIANPAAFGLTNVTDNAIQAGASDPIKYLFYDDSHPTAGVSPYIASGAFAAVPEPSAFGLLLVGAAGLAAGRRALRRAA